MCKFILFSWLAVFALSGCASVGDDLPDVLRPDAHDTDAADPLIDGPADLPPSEEADLPPDLPPDSPEVPVDIAEAVDTVDSPDIVDIIPEDIVVDDTPVDPGPGTCMPSDLPAQALCNGSNKCTLDVSTTCTPEVMCDLAGPQGENQPCTGSSLSDNCQKGFTCLYDGVLYTCRKFCSVDADCAAFGGNSGCQISISTTACPDGLTGVTTCSHHCDYFYQTGCQAGQGCRVLAGSFRAYSDCTAAGTGVQYSLCPNGSVECAAGYDCFSITDEYGVTQNQCAKICNYTGGYPTCDSGYTCTTGTDWPANLGACL